MIIIEDKIPKSIQVPLVWLETQQLAIPMGLQALVPADSDQLGSDDLRHCALADLWCHHPASQQPGRRGRDDGLEV